MSRFQPFRPGPRSSVSWAERAFVRTYVTLAASLPQRPLALSVVSQMQDPTFATFMYLLPCGKQSAFFSPQGQDYTVVFWDGKEGSR